MMEGLQISTSLFKKFNLRATVRSKNLPRDELTVLVFCGILDSKENIETHQTLIWDLRNAILLLGLTLSDVILFNVFVF